MGGCRVKGGAWRFDVFETPRAAPVGGGPKLPKLVMLDLVSLYECVKVLTEDCAGAHRRILG